MVGAAMRLSSNSPPHTVDFGNDTMNALLAKAMWLISTVVGSVTEIEDEAVPETAAAHCNIHWTILCIITLGFGFIFLLPYFHSTMAHYYEDLKAEQA